MSKEEIKRIDYDRELWTLREPYPALRDFLMAKDCLIVLHHGSAPYKVVLGVPHQAAIGQGCICENRKKKDESPDPRDSDENAASYALVAFTTLKQHDVPCKLVIMAHSTTDDPNKIKNSPYWKEIFRERTELIFECHGAGAHRRYELELSGGKNKKAKPVKFARLLVSELGHRYTLGAQKQAGKEDAVIFRTDGTKEKGTLERAANETDLLKEAEKKKTQALHLEAKPAFRKPVEGTNTVTPDGFVLGRALAQAIIKYLEA